MRTSTSTAVAIAVETAPVTSTPTTIVLKSMTSNAVWDECKSLGYQLNLAEAGRPVFYIGNVGLGFQC